MTTTPYRTICVGAGTRSAAIGRKIKDYETAAHGLEAGNGQDEAVIVSTNNVAEVMSVTDEGALWS
ncbi:hypothetical protein [Methyloceanibacter sp.]|uniref:hypothetical protein n=1 Tax=Methyloceanibacter sp. TaxID=1965321 RepID=UPI002CD981DF|nr:hypothetical protein [Methyloceanibacter sp.]HML91057.1 hypothetical protein [Methyloceanibacter sp.]